jgi:hypothetical protein
MKMTKSTHSRLWSLFPPALLIVCNFFVFGPAAIYEGNTSEFSIDCIDIFQFYVFPFVLLLLVTITSGIILFKKNIELYISVIFTVGLLLWLQGNILIWDYGAIDGKGIEWAAFIWQGWFETGLWLIALLSALVFYRKVAKITSLASVVILLLQSGLLLATYTANPHTLSSTSGKGIETPQKLFDYSASFNIIHIILDGMQTDVFQEVVRENNMDDLMDGFVLFPENTAVFGTTTFSIPAIFSGEIYQGDVDIGSFVKKTLSEKAFYNNLYEEGYDVNLIPGISIPTKKISNYYLVPKAYGGSKREKRISEAAFLMDLVLFRHLPQPLKRIIYNNQKWLILPFFSHKYKAGYYHYKSFFKDYIENLAIKSHRPAYHFVHLLPPHQPYVTCEDCEYAGKVLPPTRENYKIEVKCILKLFIRFIEKLKDLGIYDSSFIILHADHGTGFPVNMKNDGQSETRITELSPGTVGRSMALLAVKPQNSRGEMKISNAQTSVADIPATVMEAAGLKDDFKGSPVFSIDPDEKKERVYNNQFKVTGDVRDYQSWQESRRGSSSRRLSAATYRWGTNIEFGFMGNAQAYQGDGWSLPEDGLTWSDGKNASLIIPIAEPKPPVILEARLMALLSAGKLERQNIHVLVNGQEAGIWEITKPGFQGQQLIIPGEFFMHSGQMVLTFNTPDAASPKQLGLSGDPRSLGIAMHSLRLINTPYQTDIEFGLRGNAQAYQGDGWSQPEDGFTWTNAKSASLTIPVDKPKSPVVLKAVLRAFLVEGKVDKQVVHVLVNGQEAGIWEIAEPGFGEWKLIIPESLFSESDSMALTFRIPGAISPAQLSLSSDRRPLGIAVRAIQLSD